MPSAWMRSSLTLCGALLSGLSVAAGNLQELGSPVGNLVLLFNQYDYTALKGPHSNGTRYLGKYSFMPTFPISLGEDWTCSRSTGGRWLATVSARTSA